MDSAKQLQEERSECLTTTCEQFVCCSSERVGNTSYCVATRETHRTRMSAILESYRKVFADEDKTGELSHVPRAAPPLPGCPTGGGAKVGAL